MAWAAVRSGAVVLLLLIYCLVCFPLFVGALCFVFVLLCIALCPFWFCGHLEEEERTGYFAAAAVILKRRRGLVTLLLLSCRCVVAVGVLWLFLAVPWVGLQYVIVIFTDHTHLLFAIFQKLS